MQPNQLVELAAVTAAGGRALVSDDRPLSENGLTEYWEVARCRLDRWCATLTEAEKLDEPLKHPVVIGTIEEIIMSEMLARVWAAVLDTADRQRGTAQYASIGRAALIGHILVRRRVEKLLDGQLESHADLAAPMKRLQSRVDRWGNMWLGYLAKDFPTAASLAKSPEETLEFAADLKLQVLEQGSQHVWNILLHSQQNAMGESAMPLSPNADLNLEIATAIIACFPPGQFEATGQLESLFLSRLDNATDDSIRMIDDFLVVECALTDGVDASNDDRRRINEAGRRLERLGLD